MSETLSDNAARDAQRERRFKLSEAIAAWAQLGAMLAALATAGIAFWVAHDGQLTVSHDNQSALLQSEDAQLSTAINALGSSSPSERVAGLVLMERNTESRFSLAVKTGETPLQLWDDYTTALQTYSAYLSSQTAATVAGAAKNQPGQPFGLGYGNLAGPAPIDIQYAVDQVKTLLRYQMKRQVMSRGAEQPAIDLSNDELSNANFTGVNFTWVYGYLLGVDLRGAALPGSHWASGAVLSDAYLQCADLSRAVFSNANLSGADLTGANVQGADFTGADLTGAKITYVYGTAKWPAGHSPASTLAEPGWHQRSCMADSQLWLNTPAATPASPPAAQHGR